MRIPPEVIAQTTIGTSRIRPKVMRFGILKRGPGSGSFARCCPATQYTGARALAHPAIPT
jgi:hypothetical protein